MAAHAVDRRRRVWILIAGLLLGAGGAEAETGLDIEPLWGGRFRAGATTELRVVLRSAVDGTARVRIRSGQYTATTDLALAAAVPRHLSLPVRPAAYGQVGVEVELPDGEAAREMLALTPVAQGFPADLVDARDEGGAGKVDVNDLPHIPEGYGPLIGVILRPGDLRALDASQTAALAWYLSACGGLTLLGASDHDLSVIRGAAGCGGRAVDRGDTSRTAADPRSDTLLPPDITSADHLAERLTRAQGMQSLGHDAQRRIALILLPYALLLGALLAGTRTPAWVIAVPPAVTLVLWALIPQVIGSGRSLTWAEAHTGDQTLHFVRVVETLGNGRTATSIPLPPGGLVPKHLDAGPITLITDAAGARIEGPQALFATDRFLVSGVASMPMEIDLVDLGDALRIRVGGPRAISRAWLSGAGCVRALGGLSPVPTLTEGSWAPSDPTLCDPEPPSDLPRTTRPALIVGLADEPNAIPGGLPGDPLWLIVYPRPSGP